MSNHYLRKNNPIEQSGIFQNMKYISKSLTFHFPFSYHLNFLRNFLFSYFLKETSSMVGLSGHEFSNHFVEQLPGWKNIRLFGAHNKLINQNFHTYIISPTQGRNQYYLSYVRLDGNIVHVQFHKNKNGKWKYENASGSVRILVKEIIKRIIHFKKGQPEPTPYIDSIYNK